MEVAILILALCGAIWGGYMVAKIIDIHIDKERDKEK